MDKYIKELLIISHDIGRKSDYVQGGGGNTSVKIDDTKMLIKASGSLLKDMKTKNGYVCLDYKKIINEIEKISKKTEEEENRINKLIMDFRIPMETQKLLKPSIEVGFHALLGKYVMHSHSVYSNIINCSKNSEELLEKILEKEEYIFINYISPGLGLTISMNNKLKLHLEEYNCQPIFVFLENHGLVVTANTMEECMKEHTSINSKLKKYFKIEEEYSEIECNDSFISKNKYILKNIKNKFFNFENVLFPDQVLYFKDNISFTKEANKKVNFNLELNEIKYNVDTLKEARAIEETILSYLYILEMIEKNKLVPNYLEKKEQSYIENMESEKYRKKFIEKGEEE